MASKKILNGIKMANRRFATTEPERYSGYVKALAEMKVFIKKTNASEVSIVLGYGYYPVKAYVINQ